MKFFGGSKKQQPSKKHSPAPSVDDLNYDYPSASDTPSPTKSKSSSKSPKKSSRSEPPREAKSSPRQFRHSRQASDLSTSSRRSRLDPETHPLNLPPEERKRLSARSYSTMSAMDIDREPPNGASNPASPNPSAQANFSVPIPNGTTHDGPPAPPPHGSNPSSPVPSVMEEAEGYKAQGNKFFKDKSYKSAIDYYTKGNVSPLPPIRRNI